MIDKLTGIGDYFAIKEREREKRRIEKLAKIKKLLEKFLEDNTEIEKLLIVGSLVREGAYHDFSDIDIAISVKPKEKFWEIYGKLEELISERIHIMDWESLEESSRKFLEEYSLKLK